MNKSEAIDREEEDDLLEITVDDLVKLYFLIKKQNELTKG